MSANYLTRLLCDAEALEMDLEMDITDVILSWTHMHTHTHTHTYTRTYTHATPFTSFSLDQHQGGWFWDFIYRLCKR